MDNLRAITWMVLAMLGFALTDMFIKLASASLPVGQIVLILGGGGAAIFAGLARARGVPVLAPALGSPLVLARCGLEVLGTLCFTSALALAEISFVSAIQQAVPLVVVAGAALVLGETVGPRRWIAVGVGFAGVLLIVRPSAAGVPAGALLALGAVLALAFRDVVTRRIVAEVHTLQLATWGLAVLVPAGLGLLAFTGGFRSMDAAGTAYCLAGVFTGAGAYYAITASMRIGEVSAVSPFRYTRLLFALVIGFVVFGERPDALTLAGAAIVIGSGLFILMRERALARRARAV